MPVGEVADCLPASMKNSVRITCQAQISGAFSPHTNHCLYIWNNREKLKEIAGELKDVNSIKKLLEPEPCADRQGSNDYLDWCTDEGVSLKALNAGKEEMKNFSFP